MKTIEITDKAAKTIKILRGDDSFERETINELLCRAFVAVGDRIISGDNSQTPVLTILMNYHDLIEEFGKEAES